MRVLPLCIFATVTYFMMGRRERERERERGEGGEIGRGGEGRREREGEREGGRGRRDGGEKEREIE